MSKKSRKQVEGDLGGREGIALDRQESKVRRHDGCREALTNSDYNGGSAA
jgi:hypothetical protein